MLLPNLWKNGSDSNISADVTVLSSIRRDGQKTLRRRENSLYISLFKRMVIFPQFTNSPSCNTLKPRRCKGRCH